MAITLGADYDHINISDGTDEVRHNLKDSIARYDISVLTDQKANTAGEYTNLTAGSAYNILATENIMNDEPYMFRRTFNGVYNTEGLAYPSIVGNTICYNQMVQNGNFADTSVWQSNGLSAFSVSNNVASATANNTGSATLSLWQSCDFEEGHKIAFFVDVYSPVANRVRLRYPALTDMYTVPANTWTHYQIITTASASNQFRFQTDCTLGYTYQFRNVMVFDLTKMFGTTVANNITDINYVRYLFPKSYYAYNTGTLVSANPSAYITTRYNLLNLERSTIVTSATFSNTTVRQFNDNQIWMGISSNNYFDNSRISTYSLSKTSVTFTTTGSGYGIGFPVRVLPNTAYYFGYNASTYPIAVGFYDSEGGYISGTLDDITSGTFTTPINCYWILCLFKGSGNTSTTYNQPILCFSGLQHDYESYTQDYIELDDSRPLLGITKASTTNSLYCVGDKYLSDGTILPNCVKITFGVDITIEPSLWYDVDASKNTWGFYYNWSNINYILKGNELICDKFTTVSESVYLYDTAYICSNITTSPPSYGYIGFRIPKTAIATPTDAADLKTKLQAWMAANPFTVVATLNNPTTIEHVSPYHTYARVHQAGLEEFKSNTVTPVGHETYYTVDLQKRLEGLPDDFSALIAPTEKTYKASRNYAVNELVILDNVLYIVNTAITTGSTFTPGINIIGTTISNLLKTYTFTETSSGNIEIGEVSYGYEAPAID